VSVALLTLSHDPPKKDDKPPEKTTTEKPVEDLTDSPNEFTYPPYYVYNQDDVRIPAG